MSDRPTAVNGKRNQAWGTTSACPECGECLCFACHPQGPCTDDHAQAASVSHGSFTSESTPFQGWALAPDRNIGVAGLHLRSR